MTLILGCKGDSYDSDIVIEIKKKIVSCKTDYSISDPVFRYITIPKQMYLEEFWRCQIEERLREI